jgi:geranylgeranyl diphosphate synthase type II
MDDDDLRRGLPTCHVQFGEATAILAGDALLAQAFEVLATGIASPAVAGRCCAELAHAAGPCELVGGQQDDLQAEESDTGDLAQLQQIHRRKTGAMFRVSLRLGGIVGGATAEELAALDAYGRHVGLAFQITDDLLDAQGEASKLGKRTKKDDGRGKLTFPRLLGVEESRTRAAALVEEACAAVNLFGERAGWLQALARYVLARDH